MYYVYLLTWVNLSQIRISNPKYWQEFLQVFVFCSSWHTCTTLTSILPCWLQACLPAMDRGADSVQDHPALRRLRFHNDWCVPHSGKHPLCNDPESGDLNHTLHHWKDAGIPLRLGFLAQPCNWYDYGLEYLGARIMCIYIWCWIWYWFLWKD